MIAGTAPLGATRKRFRFWERQPESGSNVRGEAP